MVTKVRGSFNEFEGKAHLDFSDQGKSCVQVTIKASSVDTRNAERDKHLRSNDFFAMEEYPEISFASTAVEAIDDTTCRVTGDLTIRGTTKSLAIDVEFTGTAVDSYGKVLIGFEGSVTVNRKDWGVNWNAALEAGGVLVSEKVTLEVEAGLIKTP
jgi:polyisoprenoid-binding protein YceI